MNTHILFHQSWKEYFFFSYLTTFLHNGLLIWDLRHAAVFILPTVLSFAGRIETERSLERVYPGV